MNVLSLNIEDCDADKFIILDTKPNIIMDGMFSRLLFTDTYFTLNSILIHVPFTHIHCRPSYTTKMIVQFELHPDFVQKLILLEKELITKYIRFHPSTLNKQMQCSIKETLQTKKMKIHEGNNTNIFFLKISGIWESDFHFGVTFKFIRGEFI